MSRAENWNWGLSLTTPITFRARTTFAYAVLILGLAGTPASAWAVSRGHIGWGWVVGCVLFAIFCIPPLQRLRSLYLRLDEEGLETGSRHMDKVRVPWREVDKIVLVEMNEGPARGREAIRVVYSTPARNEFVIEDEFSAPLREILRALTSHLQTK